MGCSKYRQRAGVELYGSVGVGGAVYKTTNKKHPNDHSSDVWVLCKGIEPLFRDWESLVLAVRRTEQDYFRGAKIGKKFFVPNFDSVFLWVNVNRGEIKGVLSRIEGGGDSLDGRTVWWNGCIEFRSNGWGIGPPNVTRSVAFWVDQPCYNQCTPSLMRHPSCKNQQLVVAFRFNILFL